MLRNQGKIQNHLVDYYYKLKKPPFNKHDKVALIACANHLNRTIINRSMLRNQGKIQNHLVDYYYKLKKPPFNKHDKVALIACANHLNRTIINLVHTHQLYNYSKAIH